MLLATISLFIITQQPSINQGNQDTSFQRFSYKYKTLVQEKMEGATLFLTENLVRSDLDIRLTPNTRVWILLEI